MTEAFHLGKPCLALPMKGQFEQVLNAIMLEELGYGKAIHTLSRDSIASFLYDIPLYADKLEQYTHQDNTAITGKLDELLNDDCKLLQKFFMKRFGRKRRQLITGC